MNTSTALNWRDDNRSVTVSLGDLEIATYTYDATDEQRESPRPFFHPLRTTAGETVSVYRPWDHVWHKGIAWSLPHFGDDNFWGGPSYRRGQDYTWLPNNGSMRHERVVDAGLDGGTFRFTHELSWWTQDGKKVVDELRGIRIIPGQDGNSWTLVFETDMTNVSGRDIQIGSPTTEGRENAGYGGLFWRGPRSFTGGEFRSEQGAGTDEFMGTRSPWLAFTGQHDGSCRSSTVLFAEDGANPGAPNQWFARSSMFACLGSAPFFSEVVPLREGQPITYRYAVVIADGSVDEDSAAALADAAKAALESWA